MRKFLIVLALAVVGFAYSSVDMALADGLEEAGAQVRLGVEANPGVFCNIESAEVCVVAQNEVDCKKLQGKKVDSCPLGESEK